MILIASSSLKDEINFLSLSKIPATSVSSSNLLALSLPAIKPAAVSALILYELPSSSIPKGAITGISPFVICVLIKFIFTFVGLPTKPISTIFSIFESVSLTSSFNLVALNKLFLFPLRPIALPPESLIDFTMSLLISLANTSSTIFTVSLSVTLKPSTNCD